MTTNPRPAAGSAQRPPTIGPAFPRFGDVADVGHVELYTPRPDESLRFFTSVPGLHESGRAGDSVYLRGWAITNGTRSS